MVPYFIYYFGKAKNLIRVYAIPIHFIREWSGEADFTITDLAISVIVKLVNVLAFNPNGDGPPFKWDPSQKQNQDGMYWYTPIRYQLYF
jgi:hypothetical protein